MNNLQVHFSSRSDEWETPDILFHSQIVFVLFSFMIIDLYYKYHVGRQNICQAKSFVY